MSVSSYNTNPALNTLINGIDIGEGSDAAGYNDALRQIMADIATWISTPGLLASLGGLSTAYQRLIVADKTGSFSPAIGESSYAYNCPGTSTSTLTLQPNATVTLTRGDWFTVRVGGGGSNLNVARGAGVLLFKNGSGSSADAVLAPGALATLVYWGSDTWTLTGTNIT